MSVKTDAVKRSGFLSRLRKDQSGNTIAIFAAAIFPLVGLIGGAVDMSRIYAVKSRMQAACDAGSLAGRKVMGSADWDSASEASADNMFQVNFASGFYTAENLTFDFTESDGTVTGTASTDVPMTLMRLFGQEASTVEVICTSQMKIPHTDVMFVLDNTGSMNDPIPGDPTNTRKIDGLHVAANCFYEALSREDITDVTKEQCFKTSDPASDLSNLTQLRFGFVPYDQAVNVGKVLPNDYFVNQQSFQSREPNYQLVQAWTLGSTSAISGWAGNWTPASIPSSYYTRQSTSGWTDISSDTNTLQGLKPFLQTGATNSANCTGSSYNNLSGSSNQLTGLSETTGTPAAAALQSTTQNPPVHPASQQVLSYNQTRPDTVVQYRYVWENRGTGNKCYLERRNHTTALTRTQTGGTATKPINWTPYNRIANWTYKQKSFNVSGLKLGGTSYNTSINLPISETNSPSIKLSGSSSNTTVKLLTNMSVGWDGCIEERQTWKNTDGDPTDEWDPIPDEAFDLDIDSTPELADDATRWKFMLPNAVWGRASGGNTLADVVASSSLSRNRGYSCPRAASRLRTYTDAAGATAFASYVNALVPGGNTYHDIGLLWGARMMSPTGIFAAENATTPNGQDITRHLVFMTDGETYNDPENYTSYGIDWWDRRQTPDGTDPTSAALVAVNDARSNALCNAIKNKQITLWVVYYGVANGSTYNRLRACATSTSHFFEAQNTQTLIENFNNIADSISELKLTG